MKEDTIRGALARGYCSDRNSKKILDPDLIEDMAVEIEKWLPSEQELRGIINQHLEKGFGGSVTLNLNLALAVSKRIRGEN